TQSIERVRRHHPAVLEVVLGSPGEALPAETKIGAPGCRLEHANGRGHHFGADAVARNHRHSIGVHVNSPLPTANCQLSILLPPRLFGSWELWSWELTRVTIVRSSSTTENRQAARSPGAGARSESRPATTEAASDIRRRTGSAPDRCHSGSSRRSGSRRTRA